MYINTQVVKTEKMVSFMKTNLLLNRIARPNADTLPSRKFASPSKVATLPYPTVAQGTKSIDIPGYLNTRILRSLKLRALLSSLEL